MKLFKLLLAVFLIAGCTKEIDVNLNESNPQIVIEANYIGTDQRVEVRVTNTSNFFDASSSPIVDNAVVTITDHLGNSTIVPYLSNGDYLLTNYAPIENTVYTLSVSVNGNTYSAQSKLNTAVPVIQPNYEYVPPGIFSGDGGYVVYMNLQDPANETNFYVGLLRVNGILRNKFPETFTQDDSVTDGNLVERPLFGDDTFFEVGDTVGIELRTITEEMFDYINQFNSIVGDGQASSAPANPDTNWDNNALGYFSAYSYDYKEVEIQ